jgi:preprotein translocase subunit SecB
MKYALRGITAEELTYTINRVKMNPNQKFEIKPQFSRTIRRVQENDKLYFVSLEVKVESSETEPKPFNLKVRLVGIFEAEDVVTDEDKQVLAMSTTEIVYPYLRNAVSALTSNAFINPLMLPVIPAGTLFPEDMGGAAFDTPNTDDTNLN